MSEMIERIAKAICHYPTGPSDINSCCQGEMGQKNCQIKARYAVKSMREPTDDMANIMNRHASNGMVDWRDLHNAMIDAILSEPK